MFNCLRFFNVQSKRQTGPPDIECYFMIEEFYGSKKYIVFKLWNSESVSFGNESVTRIIKITLVKCFIEIR